MDSGKLLKLYQESKGLNGKFDQIYELMGDLNDIKNLKVFI